MRQNKKTKSWPSGHRECTTCKQLLPLTAFHKHKQCLYGYNTVCKTCRKPLAKQQWKEKDIVLKMLQRCKTRATQNKLEFNLTAEDINIPTHCPVFKVQFVFGDVDWSPSVDRIDPSKGYTKGNVQIISNKANRMKSDATIEELKTFAKWVCEI